jgi:hypothetical protein
MTPTSNAWTQPVLTTLPDLDALARMADASTRLYEQVTIAGLDFVGSLVLLSTRQAEVLSGDRNFDGFWRKESDLVQVLGERIIDCARECGDALLSPAPDDADGATPVAPAGAARTERTTPKAASVVQLSPPPSRAGSRVAREKTSSSTAVETPTPAVAKAPTPPAAAVKSAAKEPASLPPAGSARQPAAPQPKSPAPKRKRPRS